MEQMSSRKMTFSRILLASILLVVLGGIAYHNSFSGPFIFDDVSSIEKNSLIQHLWQPHRILTGSIRPFVDLSFALNYTLGGLNVQGFHALNLAIHILAALILFGIVRRSLPNRSTPWLAFSIAAIWLVHPLQTESVTYIAQRAESLMGLCYLLTLYGVIRAAASKKSRLWYGIAITFCALGMASKAVMVTAPLMVLLYDRAFLAGSFGRALRQRRGLYIGLATTWGLLPIFLNNLPQWVTPSVGFNIPEATALGYAASQPGILVHYLKLAFWPDPLVFDYLWPVAKTASEILLPSLVIGALGLATLFACIRIPKVGFLGAVFFLILLPTSGVIPISDLAVEHRMYLPLIAVITLTLLVGQYLLKTLTFQPRLYQVVASGWVAVIVVALTTLTLQRNNDYQSEVTIWQDTLNKRPTNVRAYNNLGVVLTRKGQLEEATRTLHEALRIQPNHAEAFINLGVILQQQGRSQEAISHFRQATELSPKHPLAHDNLGKALYKQGKFQRSLGHFAKALLFSSEDPDIYNHIGMSLVQLGKFQKAMDNFEKALSIQSNHVEAHNNLGVALTKQGRLKEAIPYYREALRLDPNYVEAHVGLGAVLTQQGKLEEALQHLQRALEIDPDSAPAQKNLKETLARQNREKTP